MTAKMLEIEPEELGYDDLFSDHDMDSFIAMQLTAMIESKYDVFIPDDRVTDMISVNATAAIIEEILK